MASIKLNHKAIQKEMIRSGFRPVDIAKRLKVSRQMANYILHKGGVLYAGRLARIFKCDRDSLIINAVRKPVQFVVTNNRVRKVT
jgi:hypothetical protein